MSILSCGLGSGRSTRSLSVLAEGLFARKIREAFGDRPDEELDLYLEQYVRISDFLEVVEEAKREFPLDPEWIVLLKKMLVVAETKAKEMGTTVKLSDQKALARTYDWFARWFGGEEGESRK